MTKNILQQQQNEGAFHLSIQPKVHQCHAREAWDWCPVQRGGAGARAGLRQARPGQAGPQEGLGLWLQLESHPGAWLLEAQRITWRKDTKVPPPPGARAVTYGPGAG